MGFIGMSVMGRPMAANLIAAGHTLFLHRVQEASASLLEAGEHPCASTRR